MMKVFLWLWKVWNGISLISIDSGCVIRIIYSVRVSVGRVIGYRLWGVISRLRIRNMLICVS